jgi:hypothetical protein
MFRVWECVWAFIVYMVILLLLLLLLWSSSHPTISILWGWQAAPPFRAYVIIKTNIAPGGAWGMSDPRAEPSPPLGRGLNGRTMEGTSTERGGGKRAGGHVNWKLCYDSQDKGVQSVYDHYVNADSSVNNHNCSICANTPAQLRTARRQIVMCQRQTLCDNITRNSQPLTFNGIFGSLSTLNNTEGLGRISAIRLNRYIILSRSKLHTEELHNLNFSPNYESNPSKPSGNYMYHLL